MELPEDDCGLSGDDKLFETSAFDDHESSLSPEAGNPAESDIDSGAMEIPRDHWTVEVVQGQDPDSANRMARAIDILLNAAAHTTE